jgi:cellulose synthase/poly-beta-1,6-N-acetylglucosamine synthase-like glycosyltransferase
MFDTNLLTFILQLLLYCFFIVAGIQCLYYMIIFSRFIFYKTKKKQTIETPPVSIIICAKNELENLQKNLPLILEQKYPNFEVIVINDNSQDGSSDYLNVLKSSYPHLKVTDILQESRSFKGKRLPLSLGLKGALNEWCLMTDADCVPTGANWLYTMQHNFKNNKSIVIGYAPHLKLDGFLNKCIRFETFFTAFQYLSYAMSGIPYMGVGRNMAYKKSLFFDNKGYVPTPDLISGDDDLFINKVANAKNTTVELNPASFMFSMPKTSWEYWFIQKRRHVSTAKMYRPIHQILLGSYSTTHFLFYLLFVLLLSFGFQWQQLLIVFGIRFVLQAIDFAFAMKKLKETDLYWLFPIFDILLIVYQICLLPAIIFKPSTKWK